MSIGHLEARLLACVELGLSGGGGNLSGAEEYRSYLGAYAKRLAEEAFVDKAEELMTELAGKERTRLSVAPLSRAHDVGQN